MSLAIALDRPVLIALPSRLTTADGGPVAEVAQLDRPSRAVRLGGALVVMVVVGFFASVAPLAAFQPGRSLPPFGLVVVVAAVACLVPLVLRHVLAAMRGARPGHGWWSVAAMALVVVVAVGVVGPQMLALLPAPVLAAMLLLRPVPAFTVVVVVAVLTIPVSVLLGDRDYEFWYPVVVVWRSVTLYVLIRLVAAVRELQQTRRELAARAVLREQERIHEELRRTVGVALADLAARGARLQSGAPAAVSAELPELVAEARRALAQARALIGRYRRPSFTAEVRTAVDLLAAAGIPATVVLPPGHVADAGLRGELRDATTRLLLDGDPAPVVLEVVATTGGARLDVRRAPVEVPR